MEKYIVEYEVNGELKSLAVYANSEKEAVQTAKDKIFILEQSRIIENALRNGYKDTANQRGDDHYEK